MPRFIYVARNSRGERITGVEDAPSQEEAVSRLQAKDLLVTKITMQDLDTVIKTKVKKRVFSHRGAKASDLVLFSKQLATMLGAGVTLLKSLEVLLQQVESRQFFLVLSQVKQDVEGGLSLREALGKHPRIFSDLWLNIVETGEASGNLPAVLERLGHYLEMRSEFRRKMVSAMVYPAILFGVAVIAILIFLTKIIPTFGNLFKGFDIEMPLLTRMMLGVSDAIQKWSGVTLAGGFVFFLLFRQFIRTSFGKQQFDTVKLKIPIFGNLVRTIAIEHFTSEMSTLIESGVPILYALEISERTSGNKVLEGILRDVKNAVRSGKTISEPLEKSGFFPPMVVQMIGIGEEIGELSDMLKKIAIFYEAQIETFINRFTVIIEPVMLVFMGGIIGLMVVSMFLPIFSIANIGTK